MQRSAVTVNVDFQRRNVNRPIRRFFCALSGFRFSGMLIPEKVRIPPSTVCGSQKVPLLCYEHILGINQRSRSVHQPEAANANSQSDHGQTDSGQKFTFQSRQSPFDQRRQSEPSELCPAPERGFQASGDKHEIRERFQR